MLSLDDFFKRAGNRVSIYKNFRLSSAKAMTSKFTLCIPDMHLLERGPTDDFFDRNPARLDRFLEFLDFLNDFKEKEEIEVVQVGDMYDLWQARGNTNLIVEAYSDIIGLVNKLKPVYVVGNHDIDLVNWYKDKDKGEAFGRKWRHYSTVKGKRRAIFEHGFQADMANNQESWSGAIGKEITKVVGMMEYINPDIDVELSAIWDAIVRAFNKYNAFSPRNDPLGFNAHELMKYYIDLMEKYNSGQTFDHYAPGEVDLMIAVIGHTHNARLVQVPRNGKVLYLLDCGSWVNGGHEFGVLSGKDMAICQWG